MTASNVIRNGIFLLLPLLLLVSSCNNHKNYIPQNHVVEIKDMKFQPAELKVHKGDTVTWINKDIVVHDVTEDNKAWASPPLTTNVSWKKVISKNESYFCSIHVIMKGVLIVEE